MKRLILLIIFIQGGIGIQAQSVTNSTGATIKSNNFIIEYSIGEVAITTLHTTTNDVTQGLLQPNIKIVNPGCDLMASEIKYFENPTKDKLRLAGLYNWITAYQIFASDGRLVRSANFFNNYIDISGLPAAGIYFIRLMPGCNGQYQVIKFMKR